MATVHISPRAAEVVARVRGERRGPLTFTIDGGCCEGTAPHLLEDAVITSTAQKIGDVEGVPVYLQAAMVNPYADAEVTIDVVEEPLSYTSRKLDPEGRPRQGWVFHAFDPDGYLIEILEAPNPRIPDPAPQ